MLWDISKSTVFFSVSIADFETLRIENEDKNYAEQLPRDSNDFDYTDWSFWYIQICVYDIEYLSYILQNQHLPQVGDTLELLAMGKNGGALIQT